MKTSFICPVSLGIACVLLFGRMASAQVAASTPRGGNLAGGAPAEVERISVTGSYIPTAETESPLPVTVYTADALRKQGANTPVEGLRQLPSFIGNTATENDSNGGDGQAFINLRALGAGNTLILINGRRAFGFRNVNAIPIGALARSEVLKDGASAIYGSDAVAGVVNFILLNGPGEQPYQGAEINLLYGNTTDHDARVLQTYIRGGVATDKVAIAAAAEYYDRENIYSRDREIAKFADQTNLGGFNNGSPTFAGRVAVAGRGPLVLTDPTNNAPNAASYREFAVGTDPATFNFRAFSPSIPGVEKYQYFVTGNYKVLGESLQLYGDLLYAKTKQDNGLAPAPFSVTQARYQNVALGIFNGRDANGRLNGSLDNSDAAQLAIIRNSPYNPFGDDLERLAYRLVHELNNRRSFYDYDFYRYVAGLKGEFSPRDNAFLSYFGYDTGVVYERSDFLRTDSGDATRGGIYEEIIAGNFNPFIGQSAPLNGTVPTYLNGIPTGATASYDNSAAAQRASYLGRSFNYSRDFLADAKVNGNLFPKLYQGGFGFNIGAEYRQSRTQQLPDPVQATGDQLGFNQSFPSKYKQEVRSIFGELTIPLITSTLNIPGARSLELAVAYRYEELENRDQLFGTRANFDNGGTPRISLRYQPIADLTLRASYGKSFLSPSPTDLFDRSSQAFPFVFDPLIGGATQPPNGVFVSGNPKLTPEKTDTYTAGLVFTPKFLPGFTTTVDFYQVYTRDVILDPFSFAQLAVTANGNAGGGPGAPFAESIQRTAGPGGPQTGEIISVDIQSQNASKRLVNGMDVTAAYQLPTQNWGTFTISSGYNYFFTWKAEPFVGVGSTNFLGDFTSSVPLAPGAIPYHKGYLRGEWEWKGFDFTATGNYISSFNDDSSAVLAAQVVGGTDTNPQYDIYRRVSDYITLDMQLSYQFKKTETPGVAADGLAKDATAAGAPGADSSTFWERLLSGTRMTVGVNNAFDRNPPTVLGAFNDNYDTSLYTIRNRYYYIALNKKF
ncbi:MAG: TonB-dependent receptor [Chthoniobacterales bacterium]|nr:TonB-dependent receptor [Chthoniobacterales bacterium]